MLRGMLWLIRRVYSPIRGVLHRSALTVDSTISVGSRHFKVPIVVDRFNEVGIGLRQASVLQG